MSVIEKLTKKQIHDIAETIDVGEICYLNGDTGEYVSLLNNELLAEYSIYWEEEEDFDPEKEFEHEWQMDMYNSVKADMDKIYSWEHVIRIEKPESHESFDFMERFVDEVIPEGKLKQDFWRALSRSHPFRNFNDIVYNCKYREDWFEFKQNALGKYVRERIGESE